MGNSHELDTIEQHLEKVYDRDYFESPTGKGNYGELGGYRDFPVLEALAVLANRHFFPRRVLDAGCAKGYLVKKLRERNIDAYGADISRYAIESAPVDVQPFIFAEPLHRMGFADKYFDLVICSEVMEHVPDELIVPTIREMKRVTHGTLFLTIAPETDTSDSYHVSLLPVHQWVELFEKQGLRFDMLTTTFIQSYPIVQKMKWQPYVFKA